MRTRSLFSIGLCLLAFADAAAGGDKQPRAAPKATPVAWGRPVDGLQAGIYVRPSTRGPDTILELAIVIRNVGRKEAVLYDPLGLYFRGECDGGTVSGRPAFEYGGLAQPGASFVPTLEPGKDYTLLGHLSIGRPSADRELSRRTKLAPGMYQVGVDRFELRVGERKTVELGTGYLDVEIPLEKK